MARRKSGKMWLAVGGGVALVGIGIYLATRPSSAPTTAVMAPVPPSPSPAPAPTTPASPAPPSTNYRLQISGDTSVALRVGESVQFVLPPVPAPAELWNTIIENHNGQISTLPGNGTAIIAQSPGVSVVRFVPIGRMGGGVGIPGYNVTVTVGAASLQG